MKATSVRFGSDLWEFLRYEAEHSGVSVSQYIREAALARAAAAASARGEDPFLLLSGTARTSERAARSPAERAVEAAGRKRDDARALRAQSKQAVRHTRELATRSNAARAGRSKRPSPERTA